MHKRFLTATAIVALTMAPLALGGCDGDDDEGASASESAEDKSVGEQVADLVARFGGAMMAAGSNHVEVLPSVGGRIEASVRTPEGEELSEDAAKLAALVQVRPRKVSAEAEAKAKTKAKAKAAGGGSDDGEDEAADDDADEDSDADEAADAAEETEERKVELRWDPERRRYVGQVEGDVEIVPGSLEVEVETDKGKSKAKAERVPIAPEPAHGGSIVLAGDVALELMADARGRVFAFPPDADAKAQAGAKLQAKVKGADDAMHPVELNWEETQQRWAGKIAGSVKIVPGPLELRIGSGADAHVGRVEQVAVARGPEHGGQIVLADDFQVELVSKGKGQMHAWVFDAQGQAVTGDVDLQLDLAQRSDPMKLVWNEKKKRFEAKLKGKAKVDLEATPVELSVKANGVRRRGGLARGLAFARAQAPVDVEARSGGNARIEGGAALQKKAKAGVDVQGALQKARGSKAGVQARVQGQAGQAAAQARKLKKKAAAGAAVRARGSASAGGDSDDSSDEDKKKKGVNVGGQIEAGGSLGIGN